MPKGTIPRQYQYKEGDSPLTVANQYSLTPQQLFNANPGGYPFSTGQNINIPALANQYQPFNFGSTAPQSKPTTPPPTAPVAPQSPSYAPITQTFNDRLLAGSPSQTTVTGGRTPEVDRGDIQASGVIYQDMIQHARDVYDQTGIFNPKLLPQAVSPEMAKQLGYNADTLQQMGYSLNNGIWKQAGTTQVAGTNQATANTDFTNTSFYKHYQANNISFVNQLRWDPDREKYVKIGDLLRQGKLDLQGNWRSQPKKSNNAQSTARKKNSGNNIVSTSNVSFNTGAG